MSSKVAVGYTARNCPECEKTRLLVVSRNSQPISYHCCDESGCGAKFEATHMFDTADDGSRVLIEQALAADGGRYNVRRIPAPPEW